MTTMTTIRPSDTRRWKKQYQRDYDLGIRRTTTPDRAQAHVQDLTITHGVSIRAIAEAAGTSPLVISELSRGICAGMKVTTEQAILKVRLEDILSRPNPRGSVPAVGTRRRLQALLAMGWRHQDISPLLGFNSAVTMYEKGQWITQRKHEATKRVYDQLWNQRGPAGARSMTLIAKAGYAPPLAWDDETIDDPAAQPNLGARVYAQGRAPEDAIKRSDAVIEDVEFLLDAGHGWLEIPARLGTTADALERSLHRSGRADLINRAKTMADRRDYARAS